MRKLLDYARDISLQETQHQIPTIKLPDYAGNLARRYAQQDGMDTGQYVARLIYKDQHERRQYAALD